MVTGATLVVLFQLLQLTIGLINVSESMKRRKITS